MELGKSDEATKWYTDLAKANKNYSIAALWKFQAAFCANHAKDWSTSRDWLKAMPAYQSFAKKVSSEQGDGDAQSISCVTFAEGLSKLGHENDTVAAVSAMSSIVDKDPGFQVRRQAWLVQGAHWEAQVQRRAQSHAGQKATNTGDYDRGVSFLKQFASQYPNHPSANKYRLMVGDMLVDMGKTDDAKKWYSDLVATNPENKDVVVWKYQLALCTHIGKDLPKLRDKLADQLNVMSYYQDYLNKVKSGNADGIALAEAYVSAGESLLWLSRYNEALAMLREVPQIADNSSAFKGQRDEWCAKGAFWEAHVQERQGSFTEMGKVCDNAVAQYPNASQDSTTWLKVLKAQSLFDAGQLDQAAEILKALRTQNISDQWDATLDVTEGDYYRLSKKYPEAIQAYLQAASGNANDNYSADAKYKLALCYRETGDNDKACGYLQEVIDKYGGTWRKKNAEIALAAWSRVQAGK